MAQVCSFRPTCIRAICETVGGVPLTPIHSCNRSTPVHATPHSNLTSHSHSHAAAPTPWLHTMAAKDHPTSQDPIQPQRPHTAAASTHLAAARVCRLEAQQEREALHLRVRDLCLLVHHLGGAQ